MSDLLKIDAAGTVPLTGPRRRAALGIGVFDGVHLGHRAIIAELAAMARRTGALPVALTFDPHPRAVLCPEEPPMLLVSLNERVRLLREAGAAEVWVVPFTPEFANLTPGEFLDRLTALPELELTGICVGENWRFGRRGAGDCAFLADYCRKRAVEFAAAPLVELDGVPVSSSEIRRAIGSGLLERAARLLGRPYALTGVVEYGYGAATGKLDCPTANLAFSAGVLPPDGVYAAAAAFDGRVYAAAVNVGLAPTFGWEQARRRVEVHLLDFHGSLYGRGIAVEFLHYLREERTFAGPEELKEQIGHDLKSIRAFFAARGQQTTNGMSNDGK